MSRKTRNLIWSVPLIAAVAVIGALAAFMTLTPNDASAQNVGIPPGQPTNLMVVPYADTIPEEELLLTWTEPTDGGSVRQYRIDISHNGGYTWVALESDFRNNSYTHAGLEASTTLHYRVFAINQHGVSPVSNVGSGTTDDSTVPGRPTNLTATVGSSSGDVEATSVGDLTITLTWAAPINPPGAAVESYTVEYSEDGSRWDPVPDVKKPNQMHTGLSAGQPYQYRVAAVNSVGQSGWSSTDTAETLPAVIPEPPSISGFEPAVVPEEVNVWLFWEPGDDPLGDPVTHYEVEGRPVRHAAIMLGGQPAKMADLRTVVDGILNEADAIPAQEDGTAAVPAVDDDNSGHINIAGIHYTDVHLSGDGSDGSVGTGDDFADVAALLQEQIQTRPTLSWDAALLAAEADNVEDDESTVTEGGTISHPITVFYQPPRLGDGEAPPLEYWSSKENYVTPADNGNNPDSPPAKYFTKADLDGWDLWGVDGAKVTYTGLRFKLTVPVASGNASADALPAASSIGSPDVASMLGWASSSPRRTSIGSIGTFFTGVDFTGPVEVGEEPPAWEVVDTDISRPDPTKINQYVVTSADVAGTGYGNHFIANIDWEFRVRAINGRAPARAMNTLVAEGGVNILPGGTRNLAASWSVPIGATPGSDVALKRSENLVVRRSAVDNQGRTGLILEWNKSTTVKDANGDAFDANMYRIEYSDTGTAQLGYDWQLLQASVPGDGANRQMRIDNEASLSVPANNLKAGQTRHYRVLALRVDDAGTGDINEKKTSWPSPQQTGNTAPPLRPDAPSDLRATSTGHTHVQLEWIAPDASNDDLDGSEEGSTVITHYVVATSDDEGRTWTDLMDEDGMVLKVMETNYLDDTLVPGQSRDYRVEAVNSSRASVWSNTLDVTTLEAILPNQPGGLVAEAYGSTGIKICWNAQAEQAEDAPVFEYLIEYSADGKTGWMELARVTDMTDDDQVHTIYTDMTLEPEETRHYRISAVNLRGQSDQSDVAKATTDGASAPSAPTVTLGTVTDTEINLSWTAPADDGGSAVTGWIVEKAYGGSFLNAERTNDDAFTDAQTWWDGLDCSAMVMAVMDSGTADMDNPYCKMYADLAMAEEDEVERVFGARYDVIDDAAKTNAMYSDLAPETEYMYRVAAVNAVGPGAWSNEVTATTLAVATTLGDAMGFMAGPTDDNDPGQIKLTWDAGANATTHTVVGVLRNADGTFDTSNVIWMTDVTSPLESGNG